MNLKMFSAIVCQFIRADRYDKRFKVLLPAQIFESTSSESVPDSKYLEHESPLIFTNGSQWSGGLMSGD